MLLNALLLAKETSIRGVARGQPQYHLRENEPGMLCLPLVRRA